MIANTLTTSGIMSERIYRILSDYTADTNFKTLDRDSLTH